MSATGKEPGPAKDKDVGPDDLAGQSQAWAAMLERLMRGLETGSRQWTVGRRKDSVRRVLSANRSDMHRLRQRLEPLLTAWEADRGGAAQRPTGAGDDAGVSTEAGAFDALPSAPMPLEPLAPPAPAPAPAPVLAAPDLPAPASPASGFAAPPPTDWPPIVDSLQSTVRAALPHGEPRAAELADELAALSSRIALDGATPEIAREVEAVCQRARRLLAHREHLVDELGRLCASLTDGLTELSEDESWARGQAQAMRERMAEGVSARSVRATSELLAEARTRQQRVRSERNAARDALRSLIPRLLAELAGLDEQTGRFEGSVGRHAEAIEKADTLEGLAAVVRSIVEETRAVQEFVGGARARLQAQNEKAAELQTRVQHLEAELRQLSEEVSTDALTQVANRRGLQSAFENACARLQREPAPLSIGLIDIDNFKRLNDTLGHAAGDVALKALAGRVRDGLRPGDTVARFGGEEFVLILPDTPPDEAQTILTRLQRALTASLFMHDQREVFVTFSAGVTAFRPGEPMAVALERADEALYEAKRTGKNRTCVA